MLLVDVTDDEDDTEPTKKENEMDTEWKKKMTTIPLQIKLIVHLHLFLNDTIWKSKLLGE